MKPFVRCDKCDWLLEVEDNFAVVEWLDKSCPKCNDCIIVTKQEVLFVAMIIGLTEIARRSDNPTIQVLVDSRDFFPRGNAL